MENKIADAMDVRVREAFTVWKKIDEVDVRILEGISLLGARNLNLIAEHLQLSAGTVRYRVRRMLSDSILFLRVYPYHTNMGLKKVFLFIEAVQGYEDELLSCLRAVDFWTFLCRIYSPYEGCGGLWLIPKENVEDFQSFITRLQNVGLAKRAELIWSTCLQGVPVRSRWFDNDGKTWTFNWSEWIREVETIEGELPYTLIEPEDWPTKADYQDLLIIKELQHDGRSSLLDISKKLGIPYNRIDYHFREHVLKYGLIEGYQVEIYRFPFPICNLLFFKFEFDSYEKMTKFALSLIDKPISINLGKVLGENALISHVNLPNYEFGRFTRALSTLIRRGLLKKYSFFIQDMYQTWKETIPFENFENGKWNYDVEKHHEKLNEILEKCKNQISVE